LRELRNGFLLGHSAKSFGCNKLNVSLHEHVTSHHMTVRVDALRWMKKAIWTKWRSAFYGLAYLHRSELGSEFIANTTNERTK